MIYFSFKKFTMNMFVIFTIATAAASSIGHRRNLGKLRQMSFAKYHHQKNPPIATKTASNIENNHQMGNLSEMGTLRQKSFLNHHQNKRSTSRAQLDHAIQSDESFDRLTWMFNRYNAMQNKISIGKHSEKYDLYFRKYLHKLPV